MLLPLYRYAAGTRRKKIVVVGISFAFGKCARVVCVYVALFRIRQWGNDCVGMIKLWECHKANVGCEREQEVLQRFIDKYRFLINAVMDKFMFFQLFKSHLEWWM